LEDSCSISETARFYSRVVFVAASDSVALCACRPAIVTSSTGCNDDSLNKIHGEP